jgi:flagellar motor switch/type III secretory pathway protein FliN
VPDELSQSEIDALLGGSEMSAGPPVSPQSETGASRPGAAHPAAGDANFDRIRRANPALDRALAIPMDAAAVLAEKVIRLEDVLALFAGAVIQFDKNVDDPIDLRINDVTIAEGEVVTIGDRTFGLQLKTVTPARKIIDSLLPPRSTP